MVVSGKKTQILYENLQRYIHKYSVCQFQGVFQLPQKKGQFVLQLLKYETQHHTAIRKITQPTGRNKLTLLSHEYS